MSDHSKRIHLHIENSSALGEVFEITAERLESALDRHTELRKLTRITIGNDGVDFQETMSTADALFAWDFDRTKLTEIAPKLKWIHLQGAGINHLLPLSWVPDHITLTNSRGAHGKRASEYLIMSILALNNGLPQMVHNQAHSKWQKIHNSAIAGKTLLIYGVGHVGGDTAAAAKYFGLNVIGIRRSGDDHEHIDQMYRPEDLHKILPSADFIVVTAPHTPQTDQVFSQTEFDLMKPGAGFVNYSRAPLVDYQALENALMANKINAVIDVFNQEPLPETSSLWNAPNLIITPHSSSNDPLHHAQRSLDILLENLALFIGDLPLNNVVDLEQQY